MKAELISLIIVTISIEFWHSDLFEVLKRDVFHSDTATNMYETYIGTYRYHHKLNK